MASQCEVNTLIGNIGFPAFLILAAGVIFIKYIWPFVTKERTVQRAAAEARHAEYIGAYKQSSQAIDLLTRTFVEFSTLVRKQHETQDEAADRLSKTIGDNHATIVKKLDRIDARLDPVIVSANVGFGGNRGGA